MEMRNRNFKITNATGRNMFTDALKNVKVAEHGGTGLFVPALRRQKQIDLYEFSPSLVYISIPGRPRLCSETLSKKKKSTN